MLSMITKRAKLFVTLRALYDDFYRLYKSTKGLVALTESLYMCGEFL